jgi:hypothetical protein
MIVSEPAPPLNRRLTGLDAARVFATFGIIWVHVAEGQGHAFSWTALGRFGTSFYVIVAALFVIRGTVKSKPRSFLAELRHRSDRLLRPYLVWSLIYGLYYGYYAYKTNTTWEDLSRWWGPVAGTAVHLWFLPFVFFWGQLAAWAAPRLNKVKLPVLILGGALGCVALYLFCYRWLFFVLDRYWLWKYHLHRLDRWVDEVPPFVTAAWGALVFYRLGHRAKQFMHRRLVLITVIGFFGFFLAEAIYAGQVMRIKEATQTEGRFMGNIAALFLLGAFLALDGKTLVRTLAPLGKYTYLAFLVHMLVIELLRIPVLSIPGYGTLWVSLLTSLLVFALSIVVSRVVSQYKVLAFLRA